MGGVCCGNDGKNSRGRNDVKVTKIGQKSEDNSTFKTFDTEP